MDGRCEVKSHSAHHGGKCLSFPVINLHYLSPSKKKLYCYPCINYIPFGLLLVWSHDVPLKLWESITPWHCPISQEITHTSAHSTESGALRQQTCLHERVALVWSPLILFVKKTFIVATTTETPGWASNCKTNSWYGTQSTLCDHKISEVLHCHKAKCV